MASIVVMIMTSLLLSAEIAALQHTSGHGEDPVRLSARSALADQHGLQHPVEPVAPVATYLPAVNQHDVTEAALRIGIVGQDGLFLVYDAAIPPTAPRPEPGYLAYWHSAEGAWVFGRLLFEPADVGEALHASKGQRAVERIVAIRRLSTAAGIIAARTMRPAAAALAVTRGRPAATITAAPLPGSAETRPPRVAA